MPRRGRRWTCPSTPVSTGSPRAQAGWWPKSATSRAAAAKKFPPNIWSPATAPKAKSANLARSRWPATKPSISMSTCSSVRPTTTPCSPTAPRSCNGYSMARECGRISCRSTVRNYGASALCGCRRGAKSTMPPPPILSARPSARISPSRSSPFLRGRGAASSPSGFPKAS